MAHTMNGSPFKAEPIMTRQQQRAIMRKGAFDKLTEDFGGEPRANRRLMAIRAMHRGYQKLGERLRTQRQAA